LKGDYAESRMQVFYAKVLFS